MELDTQRIRELLDSRDKIDEELQGIFTGSKEPKTRRCSICNTEGHSARTCPTKPPQ